MSKGVDISMIKIGPKDQITIPKNILTSLGLQAGDYLETVVEDGTIRLIPLYSDKWTDDNYFFVEPMMF